MPKPLPAGGPGDGPTPGSRRGIEKFSIARQIPWGRFFLKKIIFVPVFVLVEGMGGMGGVGEAGEEGEDEEEEGLDWMLRGGLGDNEEERHTLFVLLHPPTPQ